MLDGWGCREETHGNVIAAAQLPYWRALWQRYPHTLLAASGEAVGLPKGVMGNSEVGHMNLGSGRVVPQGVTIIDAAIADGDFAENETLSLAGRLGGTRLPRLPDLARILLEFRREVAVPYAPAFLVRAALTPLAWLGRLHARVRKAASEPESS